MTDEIPDDAIKTALSAKTPEEHSYSPLLTAEEVEAGVAPLGALDRELLERFFTAKWRNTGCEICGERGTWKVPQEESRFGILSAISKDQNIDPFMVQSGYIGVIVYCVNCGNMKLLNAETIVDWQKAQP